MTHTQVEDGERVYIRQEGVVTLKVVDLTSLNFIDAKNLFISLVLKKEEQ